MDQAQTMVDSGVVHRFHHTTMTGPEPVIQHLDQKSWMAGSSPAMVRWG
jgi:hypothetical protein